MLYPENPERFSDENLSLLPIPDQAENKQIRVEVDIGPRRAPRGKIDHPRGRVEKSMLIFRKE